MTSRIAGGFATVFEVTARIRLCRIEVRVAGLSRSPPMTFAPHRGVFGVPVRSGAPRERNSSVGTILGPCPLLRRRRVRAVRPIATSQHDSTLRWVVCCRRSRPDSSLGVVQRSPLRRHQLRASTPGFDGSQASYLHLRPGNANSRTRSVPAVPPGSDGLLCAVPCRSVAPCSRPWGSSRFRLWRDSSARAPPHRFPRQGRSAVRRPGSRPFTVGVATNGSVLRVEATSLPPAVATLRGTSPTVGSLRGDPRPGQVRFRRRQPAPRSACEGRCQGRELVPSPCLPRDAPPFGVFPSPAACPRHRVHCLLAVRPIVAFRRMAFPPSSGPASTVADLEALLHRRVRCAAPCCHDAAPVTPMGLRHSLGCHRMSRGEPESPPAPRRSGIDPLPVWMPANRRRATNVRSLRSGSTDGGAEAPQSGLHSPRFHPSGLASPFPLPTRSRRRRVIVPWTVRPPKRACRPLLTLQLP